MGAGEVWLYPLLTSALDGGERPASRPGLLIQAERTPVTIEREPGQAS